MKKIIVSFFTIALLGTISCKKEASGSTTDYGNSPKNPIPQEFMTPTKNWRAGAMSLIVLYDPNTGQTRPPNGSAQVIHFEDKGTGTFKMETFNQYGNYTRFVSTLTTVEGTMTTGTMTTGTITIEGEPFKTLTMHPLSGSDQIVDNGAKTTKKLSQQELNSRGDGIFTRTYVCDRDVDDYGEQRLVMVSLGSNGTWDQSDAVNKLNYFVYNQ